MLQNTLSARLEFCRKLGLKDGHTILLLDAPTFIRRMAPALFPLDGALSQKGE